MRVGPLYRLTPCARPFVEPSEADLTVDPDKASVPRLRELMREYMMERQIKQAEVAGDIEMGTPRLCEWLCGKQAEPVASAVRCCASA